VTKSNIFEIEDLMIDKLLLDKLPDVLDTKQKSHKIKNLLQSLKNKGLIEPDGKYLSLEVRHF